MRKDSVIAPILTNAKRFVPPRSAPVSLRNSIANTREQRCSAALANDHKGKICGKSRWIPLDDVVVPTACVSHTSKDPDRAPTLPASPEHRHLWQDALQ